MLDPTRWGIVTRLVIGQFGWAGVALSVLGLLVLIKRAWRVAVVTGVTFTGYLFYGLVYNVPDVAVFLIPAFMLMALWIGVAFAFVVEQVSARSESLRITQYALRNALYLLFALLPLWQIAGNFDHANQRGLNADQEAWGRYVSGAADSTESGFVSGQRKDRAAVLPASHGKHPARPGHPRVGR